MGLATHGTLRSQPVMVSTGPQILSMLHTGAGMPAYLRSRTQPMLELSDPRLLPTPPRFESLASLGLLFTNLNLQKRDARVEFMRLEMLRTTVGVRLVS